MNPHSEHNKLSFHARGDSMRYAFKGLTAFFREETNAILHFIVTIVVTTLMIFLPMKTWEIVCVIMLIAMVWAAELFNTAIERLADMITTEKNPSIKFIKDVSAAAVLISAAAALITGCIIFIPKIQALWN